MVDNILLTFYNFVGNDSDVAIGKYGGSKMYNGTQVSFKNRTNIKYESIIANHIFSTLALYKMYRWAMLDQYDVRFSDSSYISVD